MTRMRWVLASSVVMMVLGLTPGPIIPLMTSCALADSLIAKPGAWEVTTTTLMSGMPIPPDALAQMPPDKRARLEAAMQARAGKSTTHVHTSCVTQNDLDEDRLIKSDDEDQCTQKIIANSAIRRVIEKTCPAPHTSTSQMTMEVKTPRKLCGQH